MHVYSTTLWLDCTFDELMQTIQDWLERKIYTRLDPAQLVGTAIHSINYHTIETTGWHTDTQHWQAIALKHGDRQVRGRQWATELGIHQALDAEPHPIECSVVLSTSDISTLVDTRTHVVRPAIVRRLLNHCSPVEPTPGRQIEMLTAENARHWLNFIEADERRVPLVIVSPTRRGTYALDLDELQAQVGGIATVVCIPPETDTFALAEDIGTRYAAWRGAVNLLYPAGQRGGKRYVPRHLLKLEDIELMSATDETNPIREILTLITHRVNLPNLRRHISADRVREQQRRHELRARRARSQETQAYAGLLEQDNIELEAAKRQLEHENLELLDYIHQLEAQLGERDETVQTLQSQIDSLQVSLHYGKAQQQDVALPPDVREAFIKATDGNATVSQALRLVEHFFPDRLVVLETAHASARKSDTFLYNARAFDLLLKLATSYWEALIAGSGDAEARAIFGQTTFAARESESVEKNKRARRLRTFTYKESPVTMWSHLKIGVKDSAAETLRIHFHWDAVDQKLVIGHCGPHLDHR